MKEGFSFEGPKKAVPTPEDVLEKLKAEMLERGLTEGLGKPEDIRSILEEIDPPNLQ